MRAGAIVPGVVQLTHGWNEANANEMTPDDEFDPISGFPQVKEVQVAVERVPSGKRADPTAPPTTCRPQ